MPTAYIRRLLAVNTIELSAGPVSSGTTDDIMILFDYYKRGSIAQSVADTCVKVFFTYFQ